MTEELRGNKYNRYSGVLMNISSLPGPFGIGVFGEEAQEFARKIREMGFSYWQILPLGPLDRGNSPYCGESAFAGNELYIDPRQLRSAGLISDSDLQSSYYNGTPYTADYNFAKEKRREVLERAYYNYKAGNFPEIKGDFLSFIRQNDWVEDYGRFKALKEQNDGKPWIDWEITTADEDRAGYYKFVQFLFYRQWLSLKAFVNGLGVKIIGDIPLYLAYDSCDVESCPGEFRLNKETRRPEVVAGVPPDYFSEEGQLWGNPIYNWAEMKKNGYKWWKKRISTALSLYDVLRIDHFRGLASYWAVPAEAKTAMEGHWEEGPRMDLFKSLKKVCEKGEIIAEDLGVLGEDVIKLLADTGFAGMRVVQFGFDETHNSTNLPHKYPENTVAYLGTHDNNTLFGWLWEATPEERAYALDYCGFKGADWTAGGYKSESCRAVIETVWKSAARLSIIAFQDLCGFGKDARMNIPGVPDYNWRFRTTKETIDGIDAEYFLKINRLYGRCL